MKKFIWTDDFYCLNLGTQDDPCRDDCEQSGDEYFESYSLSDIFEVSSF